jgi:LL-diaminopimelate aminotransferase
MNTVFTPAQRISEVKEYYFSVKNKEIAAMNARGENVINLGIGSPDLPPTKKVTDTLAAAAARSDAHGYQSYIGIPELRGAFSDWYARKYGVSLDPACEILPLMGSKEGIMHISMAFLNPGDGVLVPNPGYPTYSSVSRLVGAQLIPYELDENNGWQPDFAKIEATVDLAKVKLMWCNYPNMPTGAPASRELFERLVAFGRKWNIIICHDNPYSFILNDHPVSILEVEGAKDVCIELNSMSKTFNMPGWRIGMAASNRQFIEWILRVKSNMDSGMFRPMQLAAVEALGQGEEEYAAMNEVYRRRRGLAKRILEAAGCRVDEAQSGLFLWGRIENPSIGSNAADRAIGSNAADSDETCASKLLSDRVLYGAKVFLTPGFIFGSVGRNYMRISLCCREEKLQEALERIQTLERK